MKMRILHWNDKLLCGEHPDKTVHFLAEHNPVYLKYCVSNFEDICVTQEVADSLTHHYFMEKKRLERIKSDPNVWPPNKEGKNWWYWQARFEFYNNWKLSQCNIQEDPLKIQKNTEYFEELGFDILWNAASLRRFRKKMPLLENEPFHFRKN